MFYEVEVTDNVVVVSAWCVTANSVELRRALVIGRSIKVEVDD
jgi:hypothetical protein